MVENEPWVYQLDWLNIINILGLDSITDVPEFKREKAIKKVSKLYSSELLLTFNPTELDELIANELKDLMKKELILRARKQRQEERDMQSRVGDLKKSGIIGIDLSDMKDVDPEDIVKYFKKTMRPNEDDDEKDDDNDKYDDDKTGYYI